MSKRPADDQLLQDVSKYARVHEQIMAKRGDKTWTIERSSKSRLNVLWSAVPASDFFFATDARRLEDSRLMVDGQFCGSLAHPDVALLTHLARPAPFGKGEKTVVDKTVRDALAIDASRIKVVNNPVWNIGHTPRTFKEWSRLPTTSLSLYKLHIYPPGGHFAAHVDTPHGPRHIGAAVLQLPTPYTGRQLVVEHKGERRTTNAGAIFAAWYTDCKHWVEKVETGHRVVLQYDITVPAGAITLDTAVPLPVPAAPARVPEGSWDEGDADDDVEEVDQSEESLEDGMDLYQYYTVAHVRMTDDQMAELVTTVRAQIATGRNVALLLQHRYLSEDGLSVETLKGMDRIVYTLLRKADIHVALTPLVFIAQEDWSDEAKGTRGTLTVAPVDPLYSDHPTTLYPGLGHHDGDVLQQIEKQQGAEHTGNEALMGHARYLAAAIVAIAPEPMAPEPS